ncbi:uncharacterized protein MICPUCDRAFT_53922 [Micromonas pusilla CCMP1545]|uniref:Predicted protein n=1 Tax=Micromonas pusilla (strain CCMP1545) TaxID=564608 RepID=C1N829_MICPC|nr:uncharacterized protein MICPUCDRAFT_53922 [Micromonas pusilla CCMP1545]EEH51820.1 predicted protein [Micromonas pusilla CCMP1545]|eukprot:XP_003064198.1 predicted protein [Micromonas pusilla CCMP1545]
MSSTRTCSRAAPPSPSRRRERSSLFFAGPVGDIPRAEDASFSKVFITSTGDAVARPRRGSGGAAAEPRQARRRRSRGRRCGGEAATAWQRRGGVAAPRPRRSRGRRCGGEAAAEPRQALRRRSRSGAAAGAAAAKPQRSRGRRGGGSGAAAAEPRAAAAKPPQRARSARGACARLPKLRQPRDARERRAGVGRRNRTRREPCTVRVVLATRIALTRFHPTVLHVRPDPIRPDRAACIVRVPNVATDASSFAKTFSKTCTTIDDDETTVASKPLRST